MQTGVRSAKGGLALSFYHTLGERPLRASCPLAFYGCVWLSKTRKKRLATSAGAVRRAGILGLARDECFYFLNQMKTALKERIVNFSPAFTTPFVPSAGL